MRKNADIVVIGGGCVGCSIAYHLAEKGIRDVVVLEKRFLTGGATGACAAGFRQQWGTELNCLLSRGSIEMFKSLNEEEDLEFRQSGYLLITYKEHQARMLEQNLKVQNRLGIPSKRLSPQEAAGIVPHLNINGMVAAFYCHEDGHVNPFKVTSAYAKKAERLGVEINTHTTVTGIQTEKGHVKAVITDKGTIATHKVVNATGPYAKLIGQMLGLSHPVVPVRYQILITEPLEPILGPLVMSFHHGTYCQQVPHGGFIMGWDNPNEPKGFNTSHDWIFLEEMAHRITEQLPILKDVRVIRQWAGNFDVSPDAQPILGCVPEVEGYYLGLGCGRGLMLSPMIGKLMAEYLSGEDPGMPIDKLSIERFERGELLHDSGDV